MGDMKSEVVEMLTKNNSSILISEEGYDTPLVDLGFDSLDISSFLLDAEEKFSVQISDEDVARLNTVNKIADFLSGNAG